MIVLIIIISIVFAFSTTSAKRMREAARREENRVRHHAHTSSMNIMRARVKSAQLLLEGRALNYNNKYSP